MGPRDRDNELDGNEFEDNDEVEEFENSGQAYAADIDEVYGEASDAEDEDAEPSAEDGVEEEEDEQ